MDYIVNEFNYTLPEEEKKIKEPTHNSKMIFKIMAPMALFTIIFTITLFNLPYDNETKVSEGGTIRTAHSLKDSLALMFYDKAYAENASLDDGWVYVYDEELGGAIAEISQMYVGQIPYVWGGKPTTQNYDISNGLDCSGFVQFVYWEATGEYNSNLGSTQIISMTQQPIMETELQPGDLGLIEDGGSYYIFNDEHFNNEAELDSYLIDYNFVNNTSYTINDASLHTNHVGIYIGKDDNGNNLWCHCAGEAYGNTVVTGKCNFKYFYRIK